MEQETHINAHTAAVRLVQLRISQGLMTPEQGQEFTDIVYQNVNTGNWPNDPLYLGLIPLEWKVATSETRTSADGFKLTAS